MYKIHPLSVFVNDILPKTSLSFLEILRSHYRFNSKTVLSKGKQLELMRSYKEILDKNITRNAFDG